MKFLSLIGLLLLAACVHQGPTAARQQPETVARPPPVQPAASPVPHARPAPASPEPSGPPAAATPSATVKSPVAAPPASPPPVQGGSNQGGSNSGRQNPTAAAARLAAAATAPVLAGSPSPKPVATLDLPALEQRLRDTRAIGVFTKLSLKNQVDDLLDMVREYHQGQSSATLQDAKQRYDELLMKVLGLLQDGDPALASSIRGSRDAIWNLLADREQFQKMHL